MVSQARIFTGMPASRLSCCNSLFPTTIPQNQKLIDLIKEKSEQLDKTIQEIGAEIYQQAAQAAQAQQEAEQAAGNAGQQPTDDDDTIDVDFEKK